MPKSILPQILCVCLFVFAVPSPCVAQSWENEYPYKHLVVRWDWGNSDIPRPDFSRFPPRPTSLQSPSWRGLVVADGLDLSGRDLRNARIHLLGGRLRNINFDGANLEGAVFCEVKFENCSFRGANLRHARIIPSPRCDMTDAILGGVAVSLTEEQMRSTWNFKNRDFSNTAFVSCVFPDMEYDSSFNFSNTVIVLSLRHLFYDTGHYFCCYYGDDVQHHEEWLSEAWLGNALRNITFDASNIKFDDFSWNQLPRGSGIRYTAEQAFRTHEFRQKSLHGLTIEGIDFTGSDFSGFTLGYFVNCNFEGASFKDATLLLQRKEDHGGGIVAHPGPPKPGFRNCTNLTNEQLAQTRFWKSRDISHMVFEAMNLDDWDFSNMNLSRVSFAFSTIRNANFYNAVINLTDFPSGLTLEQLQQTRSWRERRIVGCRLPSINFDNQDLSRFNFSGTTFHLSSFENANLTGAIMSFPQWWVVEARMRSEFRVPTLKLTEEQIRSLRNFREDMLRLVRDRNEH